MISLRWGIKQSLIGYVRGMPDGSVTVSDGADEAPDGFGFPGAPSAESTLPAPVTAPAPTPVPAPRAGSPLVFRGSVGLLGHGGLLRLTFADPWIEKEGAEFGLSIADPDDPAVRLRFASIEALAPDAEGALIARGTALTSDGADLFFGPYEAGTPLDDPVIVLSPRSAL